MVDEFRYIKMLSELILLVAFVLLSGFVPVKTRR